MRCPRLVACRDAIRQKARKGFAPEDYWSRPVPAVGDPKARLVVLGLAPGAQGANRTGRPFTGDAAGTWLYPILYRYGFSNQAESVSLDDGLVLQDAYVTNIAKCVPPGNRPTPEEIGNCAPYLALEMDRLRNARVVIPLGSLAMRSYLLWLREHGKIERLSAFPFAHGVEYEMPNGHTLLPSYHCSRQNTNTGRLTMAMFEQVFARARNLLSR